MKPIVSVDEMRAIDVSASVTEAVLIHRAGWAVARAALRMMGGAYGRKVAVVAGPGNNGADGRTAAQMLCDRGVRCHVYAPGDVDVVQPVDLVIDAAYGTGFRGEYSAPDPNGALVLAVDIPSGVHGDTGEAAQGAVWADHTVTFAAYKPGHFLAGGPDRCGSIELVDIGLDVSGARMKLFEPSDLCWALPGRSRDSHKWNSVLGVIAGSPGMHGACSLTIMGAQRAGAGMVRVLSPGSAAGDVPVLEAVGIDGTQKHWSSTVAEQSHKWRAMAVGPGLGLADDMRTEVRSVLQKVNVPAVVDADALTLLADDEGRDVLWDRAITVLTPHDGEFERLSGRSPGAERHEDARALAVRTNSVVLLKGSTTVVADPSGDVLWTATGDARLATAGTGDVLTGIIGGLLAQGVDAPIAAAAGACVHGIAAKLSYRRGLTAGDLPEQVAVVLSAPTVADSLMGGSE